MSDTNPGSAPPDRENPAPRPTAEQPDDPIRYSAIDRFLLWMSKTDRHALQYCTPETKMTMTSVGAMVAITGVLAFISAFFAIHSSFFDNEWSLATIAAPALAAGLYAVAIATFDREIVSATSKSTAWIRVPFAMLVGVVIAYPMEMKLQEGRVKDEIGRMVEQNNANKIVQIEQLRSGIAEERKNILLPLRAEMESRQALVNSVLDEYNRERSKVACRELCSRRLAELNEARKELDKAQHNLKEVVDGLDDEVKGHFASQWARITDLEQEVSRKKRESTDFLSQFLALNSIHDQHPAANYLSCFLLAFFIAFEMVPVLIKMTMPYTEYHCYLDARRRLVHAKMMVFTNYRTKEIKERPEISHLNTGEDTDILARLMEDRGVDQRHLHESARPSRPGTPAAIVGPDHPEGNAA